MGTVLRGAAVLDGTGTPAVAADVRIEGDSIAEVGSCDAGEHDTVVDLDGLVLAPGFIDIHTHYDAQVLWDRDLTPSSWHGITSVVTGNCGFSIAPMRPGARSTVIQMLQKVEGMSAATLEAGIEWSFETFPEYLDTLRRPTRLNVGALIGHSALRMYTMGESSTERLATADERQLMRAMVADAVGHGALGFATSQTPNHVDGEGRPVPSRLADASEIADVAMGLSDAGRGFIEVSIGPAFGPEEAATLAARTGRRVTWAALLSGLLGPPGAALAALNVRTADNTMVFPQVSCQPLAFQLDVSVLETVVPVSPAFAEARSMHADERRRLFEDPSWRARARDQISVEWAERLPDVTVDETARHRALLDQPLGAISAMRGTDVLDTLVDLSLEDEPHTRFRVIVLNNDTDEVGALLADPRCVLGLSDAGAHVSHLCDAKFATHLLGYWVREKGALDLQTAVWKLTGQPAAFLGLANRGTIAAGMAADLVAFDADRVGAARYRRVWDNPAGGNRLVADSLGIERIWVNGEPTRRDGVDLPDVRSGRLLTTTY